MQFSNSSYQRTSYERWALKRKILRSLNAKIVLPPSLIFLVTCFCIKVTCFTKKAIILKVATRLCHWKISMLIIVSISGVCCAELHRGGDLRPMEKHRRDCHRSQLSRRKPSCKLKVCQRQQALFCRKFKILCNFCTLQFKSWLVGGVCICI